MSWCLCFCCNLRCGRFPLVLFSAFSFGEWGNTCIFPGSKNRIWKDHVFRVSALQRARLNHSSPLRNEGQIHAVLPEVVAHLKTTEAVQWNPPIFCWNVLKLKRLEMANFVDCHLCHTPSPMFKGFACVSRVLRPPNLLVVLFLNPASPLSLRQLEGFEGEYLVSLVWQTGSPTMFNYFWSHQNECLSLGEFGTQVQVNMDSPSP